MALEYLRLGRSLSRFELMAAVVIIVFLIGLGIRKMLILAAYAERQFMESTVININTALRYRAGLYQLRGEWKKLAAMEGMNPFSLVTAETVFGGNRALTPDRMLEDYSELQVLNLPSRYLGELDSPDPDTLPSGSWYFDHDAGLLVYVVTNTEFFTSVLSGPDRIRYRVTVEYQDNDHDGRYDPETDDFTGIEMKNLEGYRWVL